MSTDPEFEMPVCAICLAQQRQAHRRRRRRWPPTAPRSPLDAFTQQAALDAIEDAGVSIAEVIQLPRPAQPPPAEDNPQHEQEQST